MLGNTVLNQLDYHELPFSFDTQTYEICKRFLSPKDRELAGFLAGELEGLALSTDKKRLSVLDLGTGEGDFLRYLSSAVVDHGTELEFNCIEDDLDGYESFSKNWQEFLDSDQKGEFVFGDARDELPKMRGSNFDTALLTHFFYHLPKNEWGALLSNLAKCLKKDGKVSITLVRRDSDIYQAFGKVRDLKNIRSYEFSAEETGHFFFSDDMHDFLQSKDVVYNYEKVNGKIEIGGTDLERDKAEVANGNLRSCALVRFLSFMFRVPPEMILAAAADDVRRVVLSSDDKIDFVSMDDVFIIDASVLDSSLSG